MNSYRTHLCSQLNIKNLNDKVTLSGCVIEKLNNSLVIYQETGKKT